MTEDQYLTISNLAKMRVLIRGIGELFLWIKRTPQRSKHGKWRCGA